MTFKKICLIAAVAIPLIACGPYFPNTILPGLRSFQTIPLASWYSELDKIDPKNEKNESLKEVEKRGSLENEFLDALKYYKVENSEQVLEDYRSIRDRIEKYRKDLKTAKQSESVNFPRLLIPESLPEEFRLYLDGAVSYYEKQYTIAENRWKKLLELPKEKRLFRTVWARYMIAEVNMGTNPELWEKQYDLLRLDVKNGFKDVQGLGIATYGNAGYHYFHNNDFVKALKNYYFHHQHGGRGAPESIRFTLWKLFKKPGDHLKPAARDPLCREIISRYLISTYSGSDEKNVRENWTLILEQEGVVDEKLLDQLAWMAYINGDLEGAKKYIEKSQSKSFIRLWLQSRFALRNGEKELAFQYLKSITESIKLNEYRVYSLNTDYFYAGEGEEDFKNYSLGEMALIKLEKGRFEQSLSLFFQSTYYEDAAYLAERILTADELKKFIDKNKIKLSQHKENFEKLRRLLARKLTREGKWEQALPYFPEERKKKVKELFTSIKHGRDEMIANEKRADYLWNAAVISREWGMSLLGTELYPDAAIYNGSYESTQNGQRRLELHKGSEKIEMTDLEKQRLRKPPASPLKRFHYRYTASDLAWEAVKLMKKNDVEAAKRLIIAGGWLKGRDPKAAARFYKELVIKCKDTELGREADRLRWFPSLPKEE